jgi:hypothetical protein
MGRMVRRKDRRQNSASYDHYDDNYNYYDYVHNYDYYKYYYLDHYDNDYNLFLDDNYVDHVKHNDNNVSRMQYAWQLSG